MNNTDLAVSSKPMNKTLNELISNVTPMRVSLETGISNKFKTVSIARLPSGPSRRLSSDVHTHVCSIMCCNQTISPIKNTNV